MKQETKIPKKCVNAYYQAKIPSSEVNWLMDCPIEYYAKRDKQKQATNQTPQ